MSVFLCPLQVQPLFRDHARVSRVPAGATSGDCEAFPIVIGGAARGHVGALICRGGALLGGRELLLLLLVLVLVLVEEEGVVLLLLLGGRALLLLLLVLVEEEGVVLLLRLVVWVVVLGASPIILH
jgi:hypothetical protein